MTVLNALIDEHNILADNEEYYYYKADINNTAGTITIPTGATIVLDQFQGGADAFCSTIVNGKQTLVFPVDSSGTPVDVATFNALGAYTLTGTPSAYPVALIYILKIKAKDQANLVEADIVEEYPIEELSQKANIAPRVDVLTSSTSYTLNLDAYDQASITALSGNITINAPTGTVADGRVVLYRLLDNGTARTVTLNAIFVDLTSVMFTSTTIGKACIFMARYASSRTKYEILAVVVEP